MEKRATADKSARLLTVTSGKIFVTDGKGTLWSVFN